MKTYDPKNVRMSVGGEDVTDRPPLKDLIAKFKADREREYAEYQELVDAIQDEINAMIATVDPQSHGELCRMAESITAAHLKRRGITGFKPVAEYLTEENRVSITLCYVGGGA